MRGLWSHPATTMSPSFPRRHFLTLLPATLVLLAPTLVWAAPRAEHVFVISFDGGKPAVLKMSKMPTFMAMAAQGSATWKARTILPSVTLPSHVSMLTGVQPAKHKITWNDWKPEKGVVSVPTMFKLAKAAGYSTALFGTKGKFQHFNVPGSLDKFQIPGYKAKDVAKAAANYIVQKKPGLCFIHFADGDGAGHSYGWGSSRQVKAFENTDVALKVVRDAIKEAGIEKSSTVILTADHGGHGRSHGSASPEDVLIPWVSWGAGVKRGTTITAPVGTCDTAATALWLLDVKVPENWDGKPVKSAFERGVG